MLFQKLILHIYRKTMHSRCDDTGLLYYFTAKDFPGLTFAPYTFPSSLGHTLQGGFYYYGQTPPAKLVVFDHGFGGGHTAYMKEIELLAKAGYLVFAYDHTGCMASGGAGARGLSQSLRDLDDCLNALKGNSTVDTKEIYVVGHSWGGFSTMNISALHPEVKKVVVISGFVSVGRMVGGQFSGKLSKYAPAVFALEQNTNPDYVFYDGIDTLSRGQTKAFLIYDAGDPLVSKAHHYDPLFEALNGVEGISFLLTEGKAHNPNYTKEAVLLLGDLNQALKKGKKLKSEKKKQAFKDAFDWDKITEQDPLVWEQIFSFLD